MHPGFLIAAVLVCSAARADKLDALLSQVEKAYGGERALSLLRVVRETGTLESRRGVARTVRLFASPDRLRIEIHYPEGEGEIRLLSGPHAWRDGVMVQGPLRDAMLLQAARLDLPGLLFRHRKGLVDLGVVQRDGANLRGIGVPLEGTLNVAVLVDPATGRILRSEGELASPNGPVHFATSYEDFRSVGKLLFAFRETNYASGQLTGHTSIEKIELLDTPAAGSFAP